jgi:hypothetical protein
MEHSLTRGHHKMESSSYRINNEFHVTDYNEIKRQTAGLYVSSSSSQNGYLMGCLNEARWRSRYSDCLRARWLRSGNSSLGRVKNSHCCVSSRPALRSTQTPKWLPVALTRGVKRQGREADHPPRTSAEVKKTWIYPSTPPIRLHGVVLI